eukprot:CAMPEP_0174829476 /NCGR_PEP_ID=MMETSP1114-20130205/1948_1 /TAXON_ID=312471 /ORGANISM="Neobodo designis, Strain CCAP 1951/1" /LENGTH=348 /DNA_ID=CAMNT_0016063225 /DNA_START=44 /DNA_END=1090 /DNA_ORIENTATION=+
MFEPAWPMIEPLHYARDAELTAVAAFWHLWEEAFRCAVVPPPLVPMVLHAAAEDPIEHTAAALEDPVAYARRMVPLLPGATLRIEHRAARGLHQCLVRDLDRFSRRPLVAQAIECGFFARAAAVLCSAWGQRAFKSSSETVQLLLDSVTVVVAGARATRGSWHDAGVYKHIVAWLRQRQPAAATASPDECAEFAAVEMACLRCVRDAASRSDLRLQFKALGAFDAVARGPLGRPHVDVLLTLTMTAPHMREEHVSNDAIVGIGRCFVHSDEPEVSDGAAQVLCKLLLHPCPPRWFDALGSIPGFVEHLFGTTITDPTSSGLRRELAVRYCRLNEEVAARAAVAETLRP